MRTRKIKKVAHALWCKSLLSSPLLKLLLGVLYWPRSYHGIYCEIGSIQCSVINDVIYLAMALDLSFDLTGCVFHIVSVSRPGPTYTNQLILGTSYAFCHCNWQCLLWNMYLEVFLSCEEPCGYALKFVSSAMSFHCWIVSSICNFYTDICQVGLVSLVRVCSFQCFLAHGVESEPFRRCLHGYGLGFVGAFMDDGFVNLVLGGNMNFKYWIEFMERMVTAPHFSVKHNTAYLVLLC